MKERLLKLYVSAQVLREEHGQDMVEYALVVGVIALACTAAMTGVANAINNMFNTLATAIGTAASKIV
jgi:pilus assembly protein Flp/PilA